MIVFIFDNAVRYCGNRQEFGCSPYVAFKESNKLRFEELQNVFSNKQKKNQAYQNAAINNLSCPGRIEG